MIALITFLITDISMVCIFAGVYGNITKYREGMLMGVHIPKEEMDSPAIRQLLATYKKRNRQFYFWNLIAGIFVCLLCFWYFSVFITAWTIWFCEFCFLAIFRVYFYHQKVYALKVQNGWTCSGSSDATTAVDTQTTAKSSQMILSVKWHLIPLIGIFIPLFFRQIRTYLLTESDGRVIFLCTVLIAITFTGIGYFFSHMPNKIYSENSQINLQINTLEKRLYTFSLFACNLCNTLAYFVIVKDVATKNWIGGVEMGIYISLELIPALIFIGEFFWLRRKKEQILASDTAPFYIDDDYYWRKGWYNNPNDKRYFIQDRVNSMNYSFNYGHPSAKYITIGGLLITGLFLLWMCILCIRIDFTPIQLTRNGTQYSILSGYKTESFDQNDIESVELLDSLPDDKFYRSDGSEDDSKLLGNFRGKKTGHCKLYIWIDHSPVLQIKTKDTTIFLNSRESTQTEEWYARLNSLPSIKK